MLNLDKPRGPTSHQVVAWVKRMLGVTKTGHAGTLDPGVSGVLPVGLERATSALPVIHLGTKEYVCVMRFHGDISRDLLDEVISNFRGEIVQVPPVRSAVARRPRYRTIHELEVIEHSGRDVLFRTRCDSGTYIRALCRDMGLAAGTGANMRELRRTACGGMREEDARSLHELSEAVWAWKSGGEPGPLRSMIDPINVLFSEVKRVTIKDSAVDAVCHGAGVMVPGVVDADPTIRKGEPVAILTGKGEVVALARALMKGENVSILRRGMFARVVRVFMARGTYPRAWK